jgi:hypothetical protein
MRGSVEILTGQTKTRLVKLFDEWATGGDNRLLRT